MSIHTKNLGNLEYLVADGIPVTHYDRSSRGAKAYKDMAEEIKAKL